MTNFITVKTPADLKYNVSLTGSFFFDRSSMRFFGDTMANYAVSTKTVMINGIECYELRRRNPVKHGLKCSAYFNAVTFERVLNSKGE